MDKFKILDIKLDKIINTPNTTIVNFQTLTIDILTTNSWNTQVSLNSSQTIPDLSSRIAEKDEQITILKLQNSQLTNEYSILNAHLIQLEQTISNVSNQ